MKKILACIVAIVVFVATGAVAQEYTPKGSQLHPTVTRVYSNTAANKINLQAGTTGRIVSVTKGTTIPIADKTGLGARVAIYDPRSKTTIWAGKASDITITGVTSTTATKDSLNRLWLENNLDR